MSEDKTRLEYLDMAKRFSIILIVLGHIYGNTNPIKYWIHSFFIGRRKVNTNLSLEVIS